MELASSPRASPEDAAARPEVIVALAASEPPSPDRPPEAPDAGAAAVPAAPPPAPAITPDEALGILFAGEAGRAPEQCAAGTQRERIRCMIEDRFRDDAGARSLAIDLYDRDGHVVGVDPEHEMDG